LDTSLTTSARLRALVSASMTAPFVVGTKTTNGPIEM
jgi:hypothetical protein